MDNFHNAALPTPTGISNPLGRSRRCNVLLALWFSLTGASSLYVPSSVLANSQHEYNRSQVNVATELTDTKQASSIAATDTPGMTYQRSVEASDPAVEGGKEKTDTRMMDPAQRYAIESKQREVDELTRRNKELDAELRQRVLYSRLHWTAICGGTFALLGTLYFFLRLRRSHRMLERLNMQVQRSKNQLLATLDAIPDPLFVLGLDGRYYDFHSPRTDLLVAPAEIFIGKTVRDVLPPNAADICMSALNEAYKNGGSKGKQFELAMEHGTFWFELSVSRKPTYSGQESRFVVVARDITERKRMESHLEESQRLLRQLAARNEVAREEERKFLTREIHDEMGQYLLALRMGVSVMNLQFGVDSPALREKTQRLITMVDSTIKVVRNIVTSLRPAALDMGIIFALEWLVGEYSEKTGLQCDLHVVDADIHLDDKSATALFRIVQESLTNIGRHAQANQVKVTLKRNAGNYLLEVRDNGQGFDPTIRKEKSFGLLSIRERALMLGGDLYISSAPGHATAIQVHFPIPKIMYEAA